MKLLMFTKETNSPRCIISTNCLPLSVPDATSSRNKSPDAQKKKILSKRRKENF